VSPNGGYLKTRFLAFLPHQYEIEIDQLQSVTPQTLIVGCSFEADSARPSRENSGCSAVGGNGWPRGQIAPVMPVTSHYKLWSIFVCR